jgi:hypothetical protein
MDSFGSECSLVTGFCKDRIETPSSGKVREFLNFDDFGCLVMLCHDLRNIFPNYERFLLKHSMCVCVCVCVYSAFGKSLCTYKICWK